MRFKFLFFKLLCFFEAAIVPLRMATSNDSLTVIGIGPVLAPWGKQREVDGSNIAALQSTPAALKLSQRSAQESRESVLVPPGMMSYEGLDCPQTIM